MHSTTTTQQRSDAARERSTARPVTDAPDALSTQRPERDEDAARRLEGRRLPHCVLRMRWGGAMADVSSGDLFDGKRVVLFGLPGAFTPTCSSAHVPRFVELAPFLLRNGIDEVVCASVNDAYVLDAWQQDQHAELLTFLPDGNGDFHRALGLLVDKRDEGMAQRARRYAMIVDDATIRTALVEPDVTGDPYGISSADEVCAALGLAEAMPTDIALFTRPGCGWSEKARRLLDRHGLPYEAADLHPRGIRALCGSPSTPQVFVAGRHLGGYEDLEQWLAGATVPATTAAVASQDR
jgi:peroxiredoxin/glutaredoxin